MNLDANTSSLGYRTTVPDLQGDTMTDNALNKMVEQLKANPIVINDGHNHSIKDEMGPTTDAWIDGTDLIVDLRVRKMWEAEIEDVLNAQMPLGGSIEGTALKTLFQKSYDGIKVLKKEIIDDLGTLCRCFNNNPCSMEPTRHSKIQIIIK